MTGPRLLAALVLLAAAPLPAQSPTLPTLSFLGFEAGGRLDSIGARVAELGGKRLRCDRARRDEAVNECRATLTDPASGQPVALWLSAIDSAAGVLTLSGSLSGVDLDRWRAGLTAAFGEVDARVQGSQWMMQWVRRGRMLRLTWRIEKGQKTASVSLIDGRVLDGWGRRRAAGRAAGAVPDTTAGGS